MLRFSVLIVQISVKSVDASGLGPEGGRMVFESAPAVMAGAIAGGRLRQAQDRPLTNRASEGSPSVNSLAICKVIRDFVEPFLDFVQGFLKT